MSLKTVGLLKLMAELIGWMCLLIQEIKVMRERVVLKGDQLNLLQRLQDLETLQNHKLNRADSLKDKVKGLRVEEIVNKYQVLINDAKNAHNNLLVLLPVIEQEKHDVWFKAKVLSVHDFSHSVMDVLTCADEVKEKVDDIDKRYTENVDGNNDKEIMPSDSVSNVKSNFSSKSHGSTRSNESAIEAKSKSQL